MAERTRPVSAPTPRTPSLSVSPSTAQFVLPAEDFALAELFERVPDARTECEPAVANPDDHALLVVRTDEQQRAVDTAIRSDPDVAAVERFGERPHGCTYRVTWKSQPQQLIQRLVAGDITLLSARGRDGNWKLRVLAPHRDMIAHAHKIMNEFGCDADWRRISPFDGEDIGSGRTELTDEQRETILKAFESGYYSIPRDTTMEELADDIGISHQALSERFRRAYKHLIATELVVDDTDQR